MCGIAGYIGDSNASRIIIEMLKRLEYRGYDSAGIATVNKRKLSIVKCKGRISDLEGLLKNKLLSATIGIGHTRWATHGKPSRINAHPHTDCSGRIAVVHNGIIENFMSLKKALEKQGCKFKSQTDTEVIAHLIGKFYKGNLQQAVTKALKMMRGSYALGVVSLDEPGKIVACRCDSPLVIGLGKQGNFIVSDVPAVAEYTKRIIYLQDNEVAVVSKDNVDIFDAQGKHRPKKVETAVCSKIYANKGKFKDFMLSEINEQPNILSGIFSRHISGSGRVIFESLSAYRTLLEKVDNIIILACGTAYHAGLVGKYVIEKLLRIPVWVDLASEFRYRKPIIAADTLIIAISQSGETADTLAAVREAKKSKAKVISICNVLESSLVRESDAVVYTHAGREVSVASTKAYTAQLMVLYLFALYLSEIKGTLTQRQLTESIAVLKKIPSQQREILKGSQKIKSIAKKHLNFGAFLYLGRNINFPVALEGALKLKEISYIPAEGYAAGEMKHGPIALIDEYRSVVCIANDSFVYDKMVSNIQEILARRGKIIVIVTLGNKHIQDYAKEIIFVPQVKEIFSPLLTVLPLQLLAYYIASLKGYDVDKPRNLAKSVTVE